MRAPPRGSRAAARGAAGSRAPLRARLAAALALAAPLGAHDFWIEPAAFRVEPGAILPVALRVGTRLRGEAVARDPDRILAFRAAGPGGERPIVGRAGADPAGLVRLAEAGEWVLAYECTPAKLELRAEAFEAYLAEEGLEAVIAERARRGESGLAGRELYSRCAKALVRCGAPAPGSAGAWERELGLALELVPLGEPVARGAAAERSFRLLHRGRPLEGALVAALAQADPARPQSARSDAEGRVAFRLPESGALLVKAVHMSRAEPESGAEWRSWWASLALERSAARPETATGH